MGFASEMVAGNCVQHAAAKEDSTDQDVQDVEHLWSPVSNMAASCGGACCIAAKLSGSAYSFDCADALLAYKYHIDCAPPH
jgi:hypothetical protein